MSLAATADKTVETKIEENRGVLDMLGFSLEQLDAKVLITGVGVWGSVGVGGKGVGGGVRLGGCGGIDPHAHTDIPTCS